ncbi:MAG: LUD domain-containing protein, partial [Patescibacteria group bacterium]
VSREIIERAIGALKANGINAIFAENGAEAKKKALEMIPEGAEVIDMTSVTLETTGIAGEIINSERYKPVRKIFEELDKANNPKEKRKLGAAPDWAVGSVHAVTEDGAAVIASATGSQLSAYAFGAEKIIWIVGAQKITPNLDEALKRVYEYTLPLESERAKKAYGVPGSAVNKLLIIKKEWQPDRITMIIVNEALGF